MGRTAGQWGQGSVGVLGSGPLLPEPYDPIAGPCCSPTPNLNEASTLGRSLEAKSGGRVRGLFHELWSPPAPWLGCF